MRTTKEAIAEDIEELKKFIGDDETYHSKFDEFLEDRLMELDKEYMERMEKAYANSNMGRWYA